MSPEEVDIIPPGVPEQCKACWQLLLRSEREVRAIARDFETHKALVGKVTIPGWLTSLIVTQLLAFICGAALLGWQQGLMTGEVRALAVQVQALVRRLDEHVDKEGHPKMVGKVDGLIDRIRVLERRR
jgi:hypothetical protein